MANTYAFEQIHSKVMRSRFDSRGTRFFEYFENKTTKLDNLLFKLSNSI